MKQPERITVRDIARIYDVPPWLVDSRTPRPRFARLRWALRRIWRLPG